VARGWKKNKKTKKLRKGGKEGENSSEKTVRKTKGSSEPVCQKG